MELNLMTEHSSFSAAAIRKIFRPLTFEGKQSRIVDYFGTNVFDLRAMAKKLSSRDLETIAKLIKVGGKIEVSLAERVATAVKEWAIEKGATHYCHWFQPQTGETAEKHDAFLWLDKQGNPIERFTGPELLQSEPDASSFPSGGIRSTFEARGYTSWDPSSPMFIIETENGKTLYIPSVFISYHGEALDFKTPLFRSNAAISREAVKTLHYLGENHIDYAVTSIGPEQEFFLVDKKHFNNRMDLRLAGRTIFGRKPPKGQELEDHYFGHIPSRVHAFFSELEVELYKLGVPIKTRHNEVAPGQYEIAPIYESSNLAADHNHLVMKCIKTISLRHGFVSLLHEKPFAGLNGSGKHLNWSIADSSGRNLLEPGATPHENLIFLTFLCAILLGIHDNSDVLRASIACAGNDHRLGANEAPPAIISIFLGNSLDKILNAIESGDLSKVNAETVMIDLGVTHIQDVAKDNTDRNRTSPFAFTGNKFEFRAVGSSASINYPSAILNAAVYDGLSKLNKKIEKKLNHEKIMDHDLLIILREIIIQTKKIRFEGNGYSQEWVLEAQNRGLSNFTNTPEALAVLANQDKIKFLEQAKIFSADDMISRLTVQHERYIKQCLIEVNCAIEMVQTMILPSAIRYLKQLMGHTKLAMELNIVSPAKKISENFASSMSRMTVALDNLKTQLEKITFAESFEHKNLSKLSASIGCDLLPKLEELRIAVDNIECLIPKDMWPLSKYEEMIFGVE
jgi:glutamine synthetase